MSKNYYEILWVEKSASEDEIKKAYRKLAMQYHPDRHSGDKAMESKFKEINEAYGVLWDSQKRREYDTYWKVWGWSPFWSGWWFSSAWFDVDLGDIFENFFGWWFSSWWSSRRKKASSSRWEDLEYNLKIDLETSIYGWKKTIRFNKNIECDECHGEWWTWKSTCNQCSWTWYVKHRQQTMFWIIEQTVVCDKCDWTWEKLEHICHKCSWKKRIRKDHEIELEIPAWIDDWMVIKLTWEWNDWVKSSAWDLYVKFRVDLEEKWLKRDWVNLYYDLDIDVIEAILWTEKEINFPIIWKRTIKIDAWTQVWTIIKLNWDWVKHIDKDRKWDLFINLNIVIPNRLNQKEREKYEEIAKEKKINFLNKKWIFEQIFG